LKSTFLMAFLKKESILINHWICEKRPWKYGVQAKESLWVKCMEYQDQWLFYEQWVWEVS
jgi:hypothetical protein